MSNKIIEVDNLFLISEAIKLIEKINTDRSQIISEIETAGILGDLYMIQGNLYACKNKEK